MKSLIPIIYLLLVLLTSCSPCRPHSSAIERSYDRGIELYKNNQFEAAFRAFHDLAENGHSESAFLLGKMYDFGEGTFQNYYKSAYWYLTAAERGYGEAQYIIAGRYEDGLGVKKDRVMSHMWYTIASQNPGTSMKGKRWCTIKTSANKFAEYLTPEQIQNAEALAKNWVVRISR